MGKHWVMEFYDLAKSKGIECKIEREVNGWIETINFVGKRYFTRSATYLSSKNLYFIGIDPSKPNENGDFVLICGGSSKGILSDIFIITWNKFFETLKKGETINTYKPPKKEYFQYKVHLQYRNSGWLMTVEGGDKPILDVSKHHYNVDTALAVINGVNK
jgi:hypothetical protein